MKNDRLPLAVLTEHRFASIQPLVDLFAASPVELRVCQCAAPEELVAACRDADALLAQFAPITGEILASLPRLKLLVRIAAGMDTVDMAAAAALGIPCSNVPDYCTEEVANHAILLMLALFKRLPSLLREVRQGGWRYTAAKPACSPWGKTLGLVGYGAIGRSVARKAAAFGMRVIACSPSLTAQAAAREGVEAVSLEQLARESDVVSLHLPLNEKSRGMIDETFFSQMKSTAFFINTARGGIVREAALIDALLSCRIAGAGLDVLEAEATLQRHAGEEVVRGLTGRPLQYCRNGVPCPRHTTE